MSQPIRIGNQTAVSCPDRLGPFHFALHHAFDAFEWFEDKKPRSDGGFDGWDASDLDAAARTSLRDAGRAHNVLFTVHAPWQANPLHADGQGLLLRSIDLARDLGAALVNLHLYMDDGPAGYARALKPVLHHAAAVGMRISIENTPQTTPDDFNNTFARLRELKVGPPGLVGMCLDIGHANLCAETRNDFIRYLDRLSLKVPLIHLHVHENYGDADTHLTLFTGPSRTNDAGVRAFLKRLRQRDYRGAMILEQWPNPPEMLVEARDRLRGLLDADSSFPPPRLKEEEPLAPLSPVLGERGSKPLPSPPLRGRGAGGEGVEPAETQPPHPQPLSPEARERGARQPPHPQPLSPEAGERGARQPPHPQPLSPEAGERGARRSAATEATKLEQPSDKDFLSALIASARQHTSWRARLQWIRDRFADPAFAATPQRLAAIAIYLRFLATGQLACAEDGGHYRPNHSAEAAAQIEARLERLSDPDTAWILRRIYPYLPSWNDDFRRAEPLTRIRDIAHRNDIPSDLKREIKERLQNKLHRSAGPEDLRTSEEILTRITAPEATYEPTFVEQFKIFHGELQEFFNAVGLTTRLHALASGGDAQEAKEVQSFLALQATPRPTDAQRLDLLERLTALRRLFTHKRGQETPQRRSQLRLADVGLEDYAFTLLSDCVNRLEDFSRPGAWTAFLRIVAAALDNVRYSLIEPDECAALFSELRAWAVAFRPDDRFHLLRLLATLSRVRRLGEGYTDRVSRLLPPLVEQLGRAFDVAEHAIQVFSEGEVRGHVVFQLSKLVDLGVQALRKALKLPPWEAIVAGEAVGVLRQASLPEVERESGPLVLLLDHADGDAEIPTAVKGVVLGHPMPLLSHLGVRARQARVPFAACIEAHGLDEFTPLLGQMVRLRVTPDGPALQAASDAGSAADAASPAAIAIPEAVLAAEARVLPLAEATRPICGAKATAAQRLLELGAKSNGLFQAPRGLALPFGVMERCLDARPALQRQYLALLERLPQTPPEEQDALFTSLRDLLTNLKIDDRIRSDIIAFFGPEARLAVRSSANGEDLENLAGAGLYDSVVDVRAADAAAAIARVWASLWTRRAARSREQAGIAHAHIRLAVLIQELVAPELSFIMHTTNPLSGDRSEALVELAAGLGETLASSAVPGTPYRLLCRRTTGAVALKACATFSLALRPAADGAVWERLDYSRVALSADPRVATRLGARLAAIASFLEQALGGAQDVEGVCVGEAIHLVQTRPQQGLVIVD